jgi:hypothetical protein
MLQFCQPVLGIVLLACSYLHHIIVSKGILSTITV